MGGKKKNMHQAQKAKIKGSGAVGKTAVVGAKDQSTKKVAVKVIPNTKSETVSKFILDHVEPGAKLYTDDANAYLSLVDFDHDSVKHSVGEYVKGQATTNGIESFWSMLRRGHAGTYHKMSKKHLQRYVNEFAGRQNIREFDTMTQMSLIVRGMDNKRLRYKDLIA